MSTALDAVSLLTAELDPPEAPIAADGARRGIPVVTLPIQKKRLPGFAALRGWLAAKQSGLVFEELTVHIDGDDWQAARKLDGQFQGNDRAVEGLEGSLKRLGLDYVDLLLIHWPVREEVVPFDHYLTALAEARHDDRGVELGGDPCGFRDVAFQ